MPLQVWSCDVCGEPVTGEPNDGLVVWQSTRTDEGYLDHNFMIVHKTNDHAPDSRRCDPGSANGFRSSVDLERFLGAHGLAMLLGWLSVGPLKGGGTAPRVQNMDEFVDFFRRVQTPYYEEARPRFDDEKTHHWLDDANEYYPYVPETLSRIADGTLGP
jgi:hypothetical protein